jgi:NodT family efflux transporter outer membrane factor (OMF) lipoprotein
MKRTPGTTALLRPAAGLMATLLAAGCTVVGPDYEKPTPPEPEAEAWREADVAPVKSGADVPAEWWTVFDDARLGELIAEARKANKELEAARLRVRRARALRGVAESRFLPSVGAGASARGEHDSETAPSPSIAKPNLDDERDVYSASFDAAWEIDLFGGDVRALQAADRRIDASVENRRAVMLAVFAEVGRNYMELRGLQRQIEAVQRNVELKQETVGLVGDRLDAGAASQFDLDRARAQFRATKARLPELRARARAAAYRLSVLVGETPATYADRLLEQKALPMTPDVVPVGLTSEIMRRRPDVRRAERRLAAATAEVGVEVAELYPDFQLFGQVGTQALSVGDLLEGASGFGVVAGMIDWPIFQGGAIRARIDAAEIDAKRATVRYEQTVLQALAETEETLASYVEALNTREELKRTVQTSKRAADLARQRYRQGAASFVAVLDAESELADARRRLAESETRALTRLVALYKSLGGGWSPERSAEAQTAEAADGAKRAEG